MMRRLSLLLLLLALIPSVTPASRPRCGGVHTAPRGVIHTPNFPGRFPVPFHCQWVIDGQHLSAKNKSIVVYLTQLFVYEGLTFEEYQIYDQSYQLNGRLVHTVTENNVTKVSHVTTLLDYMVITLKLDAMESTHLRVLDHLLDVYGFNITYEITGDPPRSDRCTMMECGFTGTCYDNYTHFGCSCFPGYEGPKCSEGPNSLCRTKPCRNGGTCVHVGDSAIRCECKVGFEGEHCESRTSHQPAKDCENCIVSCPFDASSPNVCKCPENGNFTLINDNSVAFSMDLKLIALPYQKASQQKAYVENQISRLLRDSLPSLEDVQMTHFESFPSHVDASFAVSSSRKDERRLRTMTAKWTDRGHVGNNLTMAPQHVIVLTPVNQQILTSQPSGAIYAGEDLVLSCKGHAVTPSFRWYKDGLLVNVTVPTSRKWSKLTEDPDLRDVYTYKLGIKGVSPLDRGTFTCQIIENGQQRCLSRKVDIRAPPKVWIEPMSLTVRKGENFTIKCFSVSRNDHRGKYTYSWTKNKELLPIKTDTEHYEVLFPMGSILQVSTINKSTSFSCLVQDGAVWSEQSILVNVIDTELVNTCTGERYLKLLWPETAPGTESLQECPEGYQGVARRACTLRNTGQPTWYLPDYSGCTSDVLLDLDVEFQKLLLGYVTRNPSEILHNYKRYVEENRASLLPGEGSRILGLVYEVVSYMNRSVDPDAGNTVLDVVDLVLQQRFSIINQTQVVVLQQLVKRQSLVFRPDYHRSLSTIDITSTTPDKTGFHVPLVGHSYPTWFSYKLHMAFPQQQRANKSALLALVVYRNLSAFLPQRSAIRLKDGIEMDYEILSNIASASLRLDDVEIFRNLTDAVFAMEFNHASKNYTQESWKIVCAIADYASYGYSWDVQTCITRLLDATRTRCLCPRSGTYAVLLTMKPSTVVGERTAVSQIIILVGCCTATLLTALAAIVLSLYWMCRRSCLVFLKLQCCLSMLGSMVVFVYALWDVLPNDLYLTIMTLLESFLLTGLSSQLSNLLIVYSELVQLPRMASIKQTVVLIITGAPMIAVFGNHMAHLTMNTRIRSWWLIRGSLSFNIFIACCSTIVALYFVLFYIVVNKLVRFNDKYEKSSAPLKMRLRLLKRSAVVFVSITATVFGSMLYVNFADNVFYHYVFSVASVLMGISIFSCYVLYSETPIGHYLIARLRNGKIEKKSPEAGKHLKCVKYLMFRQGWQSCHRQNVKAQRAQSHVCLHARPLGSSENVLPGLPLLEHVQPGRLRLRRRPLRRRGGQGERGTRERERRRHRRCKRNGYRSPRRAHGDQGADVPGQAGRAKKEAAAAKRRHAPRLQSTRP